MMNSFVDSFSSNFHIEQPENGKNKNNINNNINLIVFPQKIGKLGFQASLNQMNNQLITELK